MFIGRTFSHYVGTEQRATRAAFLILASDMAEPLGTLPKGSAPVLYACVRSVALRQLGHFMMGRANLGGSWVTVSGAYGSDGLPLDWERLTPKQRAAFVRVPEEVAAAYWHPEHQGHNGAGSEADAMRAYGLTLARPRTCVSRICGRRFVGATRLCPRHTGPIAAQQEAAASVL